MSTAFAPGRETDFRQAIFDAKVVMVLDKLQHQFSVLGTDDRPFSIKGDEQVIRRAAQVFEEATDGAFGIKLDFGGDIPKATIVRQYKN